MKKTLLGITMVAITLFCLLTMATAQNVSQTVEKIVDSTVVLDLKNAEGEQLKIGSGFFVTRDYVVTNIHVVENAVSGYVQLANKTRKFKVESIARDIEHSLALLRVNASGVQPLALGDSDAVQYGDTIYAVGNTSESEVRLLKGTIMGRDVDNISAKGRGSVVSVGDRIITGPYSGNAEWLRITARISHRISGGPVLNSKGEIIGVATHRGGMGWKTGNFAVSSKTIRALLEKLEVKLARPLPQVNRRTFKPQDQTGKSSNQIEKSYNVNPGGRLTVNSDIGTIDVQTAAQNKVEIVVTKEAKNQLDRLAREALADFKVTFDLTNSGVSISGKFQRGRNYWQRQLNQLKIRFLITVPRRYNVDLNTLSGNISTARLTGKVQAQTSAGNIHVDNVIGVVQTQTSAGNMQFSGIKGPISGRSAAGNITVANCQGMVDTKTSAGNIRVEMTTQPRHQWILQTSAGNIIGTVNPNIAIEIDARTGVGSLSTDFVIQGTAARSRLRGTINGGGPLLKLRTSVGNIRLLRK